MAALSLAACTMPARTGSPWAETSPQLTDDAWNNVSSFVQTRWEGDRQVESLRYVAPGSPAQKYAQLQIAMDEAWAANRTWVGRDFRSNTYQVDRRAGTMTVIFPDGDEVVWRDFEFDAQDRIVTWRRESGPLADALWTQVDTVTLGGATVELLGAYAAADLMILFEVDAGSQDATMAQDAHYVVHGRSIQSDRPVVPKVVKGGEKACYLYYFPGGDLGGTFEADLTDPHGNSWGTVSMKIV